MGMTKLNLRSVDARLDGNVGRIAPISTRAVGSALAYLRQLAHVKGSTACCMGLFFEKRMHQHLITCAAAHHEDKINHAPFDFSVTPQQLEDRAFVFPACNFVQG